MSLTVYGAPLSPFVRKLCLCLIEKGLDYELEVVMPVGQPDELARLLSQLLADDALRARLGQAARERYLREFDAVLMTQHVVDLYRRLLAH